MIFSIGVISGGGGGHAEDRERASNEETSETSTQQCTRSYWSMISCFRGRVRVYRAVLSLWYMLDDSMLLLLLELQELRVGVSLLSFKQEKQVQNKCVLTVVYEQRAM